MKQKRSYDRWIMDVLTVPSDDYIKGYGNDDVVVVNIDYGSCIDFDEDCYEMVINIAYDMKNDRYGYYWCSSPYETNIIHREEVINFSWIDHNGDILYALKPKDNSKLRLHCSNYDDYVDWIAPEIEKHREEFGREVKKMYVDKMI